MCNTIKKIVIFESGDSNTIECSKLLKDNGYQVEIKKECKISNTVQASLPFNISPQKLISDKDNVVVEQELKIIGSIKNKDVLLIQKTCHYLVKNIYHKFVLDDIATLMGSNRSKLSATFKRGLGVGVFEWLRAQRMLKAKALLIDSELSIQEIGFEVGYENSANFSSSYKKTFLVSPRQQRNLAKE